MFHVKLCLDKHIFCAYSPIGAAYPCGVSVQYNPPATEKRTNALKEFGPEITMIMK
jgi:hypothetical protein